MMYLSRRIRFSAAHRCRIEDWTDFQNARAFGKCSTGTGHGHDYLCEVTIEGPIDARTGIVVNLVDVKQVLLNTVGVLDSSHLNHDMAEFENAMPTTELVARALWDRIVSWKVDFRLSRIRLYQDRRRFVDFHGETEMVYVTRQIEFNAAHRLHSAALSDEENATIFGKCNNPNGHGHNYQLEVTVRGSVDPTTGTVIGVGEMDDILDVEVMRRFDHRNLNEDLVEFKRLNPTSEEFSRVIWNHLLPRFNKVELYKIRLVETTNNAFEYYGENHERPY